MNATLKKYHRLSGLIIAAFLLLHISNHLFALGGPSLHIAVMNFLRHIYRFPPVEIILLMCVMFQIISGVTLVFKKGFTRQPFYVVLQVLSGLYLSFFMVFHVRAVLMGRYQWNVDTDFYFAAGVANRYPDKLFFIPYYTLSLVSAFTHIACAHYIKRVEQLKVFPYPMYKDLFRIKYKREAMIICIAGFIITFLIMISFTGVLYVIT
jgi:succinate dehydrogenase/fumarate reductase cytochrome b subunit